MYSIPLHKTCAQAVIGAKLRWYSHDVRLDVPPGLFPQQTFCHTGVTNNINDGSVLVMCQ